jgi:hypothetical protein
VAIDILIKCQPSERIYEEAALPLEGFLLNTDYFSQNYPVPNAVEIVT